MAHKKPTHYEVLGIARDAKLTDVNRAYNRHSAELGKDDAIPDPRRAATLREARDTLVDPDRREAYDASLQVKRSTGHRRGAIAFLFVAASAGAAAYYLLQPAPKPLGPARAIDQILAEGSRALGRIEAIDMSGRASDVGIAFAIEEGVMVTSCAALPAGAQLTVKLAPRKLPARVASADKESGLCRLTVEGAGAWPLALSPVAPGVGEKVYAMKVNSIGQVALAEAKVTNLFPAPKGKIIEVAIAHVPESAGSPLLDGQGRVVGVATEAQDSTHTRNVPVPVAWVNEAREVREPPIEYAKPVTKEASRPETQRVPGVPGRVEDIPPEKREALEKAFRPPPNIPSDL